MPSCQLPRPQHHIYDGFLAGRHNLPSTVDNTISTTTDRLSSLLQLPGQVPKQKNFKQITDTEITKGWKIILFGIQLRNIVNT